MLQRINRDLPVLCAVVLVILFAWIITFRGGHDWGGDFSLYIAHARNIAQGRGYTAVNFVIAHDSPLQSPPAYPPVFPLLLAPVYAVYGLDYSALKIFVQALWFVFVVLFYFYVRRMGLGRWLAGSVLIVLMLSYVLLDLKDSVLSESTYMVVSTAALLLLDHVYGRRLDELHPVRYGALVGLMLAVSILTRITGIGLVAAFGIYELYRFRRIRLFAVAAGVVFAVFFVVYQLTLAGGGGGYANHVAWKPEAWVANLVFYFKSPALLWGPLPVPFRYSLAIAFLVVSGLGFFRRVVKEMGLAELYAVLYMIPLLLFHNGATPRYCVPVYALLLVYAAEELRFWITTYLAGERRAVAWAAVAVIMFAASAWNVEQRRKMPDPDGPEANDFQTLVGWVRQNTGVHDAIVFNNPRVLALYTDRPSAACIDSTDLSSIRHYLEEVHANWIITFDGSELDRPSIPVVRQHPEVFRPVSRFGRFEVYRAELPPTGVTTL